MKSLLQLWIELADQVGSLCRVSTSRDQEYVTGRVEAEGVSFLTITLPSYARAFEQALRDEVISPDLFPGFRTRKGEAGPMFLSGLARRVFDYDSGAVLQDPDPNSIFGVRQLTLFFNRLELECTDARKQKAIDGYLAVEEELRERDERYGDDFPLAGEFQAVARLLYDRVLSRLDDDILIGNITGRHGSGQTADRLQGNLKYDFVEWPERLEEVFPFGDHAQPSRTFDYVRARASFLPRDQERAAKLSLVPKTLKTPRVICIEPTCMQYMQQGIMQKLVDYLEDSPILNGMIGFRDQTPNQRLAKEGSVSGLLATLDLSEASDRVSNQHVFVLVHDYPFVWRGLSATRSEKVDVPGHGVINVAKFASMGSATCFPIEAMVFLAVVFVGIQRSLHRPLTMEDVRSLHGRVRVYGDDIIVPTHYARDVIDCLEAFGFKVNTNKSFWTGKFRESCGAEFYDGHNVSVVRCRRELPRSRGDARQIISAVSMRNHFWMKGLFEICESLDSMLESVLGSENFPRMLPNLSSVSFTGEVGTGSAVLGRFDWVADVTGHSRHYHHPVVRGWVARTKKPKSVASGEGSLLKMFLLGGSNALSDREHLLRYGRPKAVAISLQTVPCHLAW